MNNLLNKTFKAQKLGRSLELFIVVAVFGIILMIVIVQPLDGDTWWHLRAGEVTLNQGKPLTIDTFSYTKFGQSWASHGWLTELWLYSMYLVGGFTALTIWIALMALLVVTIIFFQMEGPPVYRVVLSLFVALLLLPFLKARPQMTSLVFFILTFWILHLFRTQKRDLIVWLIPIFILWANFHGGFVAGFLIILITLIGDSIGRIFNEPGSSHLNRSQTLKLIVVLLLCAIAVMIHPLGIKVWTTLYNTMQVGGERALIVEWASPDFHDPVMQLYLWFLLGTLVIFSVTPRKVSWVELMIFSAFTAMGFIWRRNLSFMVVYGMVIISKYLWSFIEKQFKNINSNLMRITRNIAAKIKIGMRQNTPKGIRILFWILIAYVWFGAEYKIYMITTPRSMTRWEGQLFPVKAKEWIVNNKPERNMLNSYNWGGYFEWYLRDYPVYLDSRADLFGNEIIYQWMDVMDAKGDWQEILKKWDINFIVVEPGWRIVDLLPYYGWNELYRDDQSVIFGRESSN